MICSLLSAASHPGYRTCTLKTGAAELLRRLSGSKTTAGGVCAVCSLPYCRGEKEELLHLDQILHQCVIGQEQALSAGRQARNLSPTLSSAPVLFSLRPSAFSLSSTAPSGSLLFLGPTDVGKTELARARAESLFDSEENIVRIDQFWNHRLNPHASRNDVLDLAA